MFTSRFIRSTLCIVFSFGSFLVCHTQALAQFANTDAPDSLVFDLEPEQSVRSTLLDHYARWAGTRHRLGATGHNGVDCSSFIQTLFQDRFQVDLPRSSREQMVFGSPVDRTELRSGDLLFFRTGPTRRHVGVYLGNQQFMHVSTSAGVEIARLFSPYWQRHFITARRVDLPGTGRAQYRP